MKKIKTTLFMFVVFMMFGAIGMINVNAGTDGYGVWVNGEEFTPTNTTINCYSGTATYDNSTTTLTLNNAHITNAIYKRGSGSIPTTNSRIYTTNSNFKITLVGNNSITFDEDDNTYTQGIGAGITSTSGVLLNGTGTLKIKDTESINNDWRPYYGIVTGLNNYVTVNSGDIEVEYAENAIYGKINTSNYTGAQIMGSDSYALYFGNRGIGAIPYTDAQYNQLMADDLESDESLMLQFIKIGNYPVYEYRIAGTYVDSYNNEIDSLYDVREGYAFEGQYVVISDSVSDDLYNLFATWDSDITIADLDAGTYITDSIETYSFDPGTAIVMPAKNISIETTSPIYYDSVVYNYTAKLYGYDDVKLSWDRVNAAVGYYIYFKKSPSTSYTLLARTSACSTAKCTYYKANLYDGKKYIFKIVPYTTFDGEKVKSSSPKYASVYTLKAPTNLYTNKYKSSRNAEVGFYRIDGATGYTIYRYNTKYNKYKPLISIKQKTTKNRSIVNYNLTKGKKYYYKVRAYKIVDGKRIYGPWSKTISYRVR